MRAVQFDDYGDAEVLHVAEAPEPAPDPAVPPAAVVTRPTETPADLHPPSPTPPETPAAVASAPTRNGRYNSFGVGTRNPE